MEANDRSVPEAPPAPDAAGGAPPAAPPGPQGAGPAPPGKPRKGLIAVIVAVVAVALVALGVAGWMYYETTMAQRAAVELLEEATGLVESADAVVLDLDEIVRTEIDSETATRAADVGERVPGAAEELEEAISLIDRAVEDLPAEEIAYARALEASARARLEMLEHADPILEANEKAGSALGPALEGWEVVLEANALLREAVEEYNKLTRESVTRSAELTREAETTVREARELFEKAADAFPEADFSMYLEYIDAKLDAIELSKKADEAFLDDKPAEANTLSDRFNEAQRELASEAEELPGTPAEQIATAYEELAASATEEYLQARARATEADARLREVDGRPSDE